MKQTSILYQYFGPTQEVALTDVAQGIEDMGIPAYILAGSDKKPLSGLLVSVEGNAARFALGGTTPVADGVGHEIEDGGSLHITGGGIRLIMFVNAAAGDNSTIQVSPQYDYGGRL